jgi:hypothetical protein
MRRAEAKLGILREVIERVKAGEDVDVEKMLGTGVESEEMEWAEGEFDSNSINQRGDVLMNRSNEGDSQRGGVVPEPETEESGPGSCKGDGSQAGCERGGERG